MRKTLFCAAALAMAMLAWGAGADTPAKKAPARKGGTKSAASKRAAGAKKAGSQSTVAARRGKKAPAKRTTWRNRQMAPAPERYKQIQDALVSKGYLKSADATGAWNQSSVDALKQFQAGQNLESTGKINSLSLIALGLGPRHEPATPARPAEPVPQQ
ncbi:MAG: peptidoglycan-binding protein [Acidobacteriia bacterium]|nr:peptidoglycan-binding protein [Terriglobia bacterium]